MYAYFEAKNVTYEQQHLDVYTYISPLCFGIESHIECIIPRYCVTVINRSLIYHSKCNTFTLMIINCTKLLLHEITNSPLKCTILNQNTLNS